VGGREAGELATRGDVKLQEDLAQVVLHRAGADEQLGADLGVGKTISGQPSDMCLLWCEHAARVVGAPARGLARGQELVTGALGKPLGPDRTEYFVRGVGIVAPVDADAGLDQLDEGPTKGDDILVLACSSRGHERLAVPAVAVVRSKAVIHESNPSDKPSPRAIAPGSAPSAIVSNRA
jgi:hypothetical protein